MAYRFFTLPPERETISTKLVSRVRFPRTIDVGNAAADRGQRRGFLEKPPGRSIPQEDPKRVAPAAPA
jgi:hypothetical protein